jgi:sec-independent protein translocase protein TatC
MIVLYLLAVVVTVVVDRRRAKRLAAMGVGDDLDDDEASPLDEAPSDLETPAPVDDTAEPEPVANGPDPRGRDLSDAT